MQAEQARPDIGPCVRERLWELALKASVPLSVMLAGILVTHEIRLTKIEEYRAVEEAHRFSRAAGEVLKSQMDDVKTTLADIKRQIGNIESKMK